MLLKKTEYLILMGYRHKLGGAGGGCRPSSSAHRLSLLSADICGTGHQVLSPGIITHPPRAKLTTMVAKVHAALPWSLFLIAYNR